MKKWQKIDPTKTWIENGIPKNSTFILFDKQRTSGLSIYEAMFFDDGTVGCPAGSDDFEPKDFYAWRKMIKLPDDL